MSRRNVVATFLVGSLGLLADRAGDFISIKNSNPPSASRFIWPQARSGAVGLLDTVSQASTQPEPETLASPDETAAASGLHSNPQRGRSGPRTVADLHGVPEKRDEEPGFPEGFSATEEEPEDERKEGPRSREKGDTIGGRGSSAGAAPNPSGSAATAIATARPISGGQSVTSLEGRPQGVNGAGRSRVARAFRRFPGRGSIADYEAFPSVRQLQQAFAEDAREYREEAARLESSPRPEASGGPALSGRSPTVLAPNTQASPRDRTSSAARTGGTGPRQAPVETSESKPSVIPEAGTPRKVPMLAEPTKKGILFPDISAWNHVNNWNALAKASRGIIAMKVRQVKTDPLFHKSLKEAERRRMIVLGYAFGYGASGKDQADAFLKNFPSKPGRIPVLDLERNPYGSGMTTGQAIAFVKRVRERTGRYPILYVSASRPRPGALAQCPLWAAQWGPTKPKGAAIWQFTDGRVGPSPHKFPGIGRVDINRLLVSYATLRRWAGLDRPDATLLAMK